jgi:hypothetical protein
MPFFLFILRGPFRTKRTPQYKQFFQRFLINFTHYTQNMLSNN